MVILMCKLHLVGLQLVSFGLELKNGKRPLKISITHCGQHQLIKGPAGEHPPSFGRYIMDSESQTVKYLRVFECQGWCEHF